MNNLSYVLKKLRGSRNLSQLELARKAGVSSGIVGEIEVGRTKSTPATLEKLSRALDLTKDEREELFFTYIPKDLQKLDKQEKLQREKFINQAETFFNDASIPDEDKEKILATLQEAFYMAKIMNKRK